MHYFFVEQQNIRMSEIKSSNKNKSESTSLQKRNTPVSSLKLIEIETQKNDNNEKENKQLPKSTGVKNRKDERKISAGQGHVLMQRNCRNQEQDESKVKFIIDELLKQKMSPKLLLERMQLSEICCQKSVQFIRKLMLETRSSKKRRKMEKLIQMLDFTKESLNISRQERSTIGQNLKKLEKRIYILTLHIRRQNKFIESLESRVKQGKTWDKYLESEKRFFEGANAYIETEPKDFRLVDFSQQWNQQQSRKHNIFSERHIRIGSQSSEEEPVRSQENLSAKKSLRLRPEVYNIHLSSNGAQPRNNSQEQISNIVHELRRMNRSLQEHLQPPRLSRLNQSPIVQLLQQQRRQNSRLGHQQSIAEQIDLISDPPVVRSRRQNQQIDNQNENIQDNQSQLTEENQPLINLSQEQQNLRSTQEIRRTILKPQRLIDRALFIIDDFKNNRNKTPFDLVPLIMLTQTIALLYFMIEDQEYLQQRQEYFSCLETLQIDQSIVISKQILLRIASVKTNWIQSINKIKQNQRKLKTQTNERIFQNNQKQFQARDINIQPKQDMSR